MAARHELGCIPRVATNDGFEHGRSSIPDENERRLLVESPVCPRVNERPLLALTARARTARVRQPLDSLRTKYAPGEPFSG